MNASLETDIAGSRAAIRPDSAATSTSCPVCASPTQTQFRGLYDDRYGYPELFALQTCRACGHQHLQAQFTPSDLTRLYTQYYPRGDFAIESFAAEQETSGFSAWLRGDRASAFRWVPRNVRVLDIGCGVGQTLAYHRNRGCDAIGVEADANVQPIAKRFGLDIRQGIFDASLFPAASFDYVTLDQVAEHVTDPNALMQGVAHVLKPGGTVVITTPNAKGFGAWLFGRRWLNWHAPYHLQFYTTRSMTLVANRAGLKLVKSKTLTASEWQFYQWYHLLTFPERGTKSGFWSGHIWGSRPRVARIMALARRLKPHHVISRLLDVTGLGDGRIFVLTKP